MCACLVSGLDKIKLNLRPDLKQRLKSQYGTDPKFTQVWDWVQTNELCCGVDGPTDFLLPNGESIILLFLARTKGFALPLCLSTLPKGELRSLGHERCKFLNYLRLCLFLTKKSVVTFYECVIHIACTCLFSEKQLSYIAVQIL